MFNKALTRRILGAEMHNSSHAGRLPCELCGEIAAIANDSTGSMLSASAQLLWGASNGTINEVLDCMGCRECVRAAEMGAPDRR